MSILAPQEGLYTKELDDVLEVDLSLVFLLYITITLYVMFFVLSFLFISCKLRSCPVAIYNYIKYFNTPNFFVLQSFREDSVRLLPSTHAQTLPASITLQTQPGEGMYVRKHYK
jgi:hypothetical protein